MKRVPATLMTGDRGENLASGAFMEIGWAPPQKIPQDIDDDQITFARVRPVADQADGTWDIEAPVFIQVKASPTEYREATDQCEVRMGWWFTEPDTAHFDQANQR